MASDEESNESTERLLGYLEQRTGRRLRSRKAIDEYVAAVGASDAGGGSARLRDPGLRITAGLGVLALMFLFYYFMDVGLQISSLRSSVLTPATITFPLDHRHDRSERARSEARSAISA